MILHCAKMSMEEKLEYSQKQFTDRTLELFDQAEHPVADVFYAASDLHEQ